MRPAPDLLKLTATASESPLRIALVSTQTGFRGGESQLMLLARGLRRRGQQVCFFCRSDGELLTAAVAHNFEAVPFKKRGRAPSELWKLRRVFQSWRPHVVYCNDSHAVTAMGIASLGLRIPLRVAGRRVVFPLRSSWKYRHCCDLVVGCSEAVRQVCLAAGIPPQQTAMIYDGLDLNRVQDGERERLRAELGLAPEVPLLLAVGALSPEKGLNDLLQAVKLVEFHRPPVHLALAGQGPLLSSLQGLAKRLKIAEQIHFLGQRNDLANLLAAADCFVLSSLAEGLNGALIEAMAAGVPCIATAVGGTQEILSIADSQGPVAIAVPPSDPLALAHALEQVLAQPSVARQQAEQLKPAVIVKFAAERMVDEYLELFRQRVALCSQASCA